MKPFLKNNNVDYLIVGGGLAGSILAFKLLQRGAKVVLVDNNDQYKASSVSQGFMSPIVGVKLALTWKCEEAFPYALNFYKEIEKTLGLALIEPKESLRIFRSKDQRAIFEKRKLVGNYGELVEESMRPDPANVDALMDDIPWAIQKLLKNTHVERGSPLPPQETSSNTLFQ